MQTRWLEVEPGVRLRVVVDDYTDPWEQPATVLMMHGMGQSLDAWRGWVPYLARQFRVVRFDTRGFGASTPPPEGSEWTTQRLLEDIDAVMRFVDCAAAHVVGAQSGGTLALAFAARHPERVRSLVAATPMIVGTPAVPGWLKKIEADGVRSWAHATMAGRLGTGASQEEIEYWVENVQGKTPLATLRGYLRWAPQVDIREELNRIRCPSLIMTTTGGGLRSVDSVKEWQRTLPNSALMVIEGDAWAPAVAYPDLCAPAAARFLSDNTPAGVEG